MYLYRINNVRMIPGGHTSIMMKVRVINLSIEYEASEYCCYIPDSQIKNDERC